MVLGAWGPHFGAPRASLFFFIILTFPDLLFSLLFSFLSLFSRICYYVHPLVSLLSALVSLLFSLFSSVFPAARRLSRSELGSAAPLHAVAAPSRRVKAERLSSSRAPALYSDSESHYYWDAKIKEIATSRKRATLQHFSLLWGPKPSKTQGRLGSPNPGVRSTVPPPGTPEIEGGRPRALPRRSGDNLLRFSALFSLLLCLCSSSQPVLVPF